MNKLREKLARGEKALGTHIQLNDSFTTEIVASLGFDYLWIDTEHTTLSLEQVDAHLIAARAAGVSAIVRVPWNDAVRLKPILEMGPDGVVIPMVNSYEEALYAVKSCMYPPKGTRGYGPKHAALYGMMPLNEYLAHVDENLMKMIQIEHINAVHDLDRIVTIEDIDAYIIGPMDLSGSIGKMGQLDDPEVCGLLDEIITKVHAAGKPVGVSFGLCGKDEIKKWHDRGVDFISLGTETDFIIVQARNMLSDMKEIML